MRMEDRPPIETLPQHEWDALIGSIVKRYYHLCGDDALIDREDLQQEAWIALLNATQDYDPEKAKFSTFAHQRIRYHLCNYISQRIANKPTQVADDPFEYTQGTTFVDETVEQRDLVDTIFGKVAGEQHAHLLRDHFLGGLTYRTLATMYSCSHETIRARIDKLLGVLEKRLSKDNDRA